MTVSIENVAELEELLEEGRVRTRVFKSNQGIACLKTYTVELAPLWEEIVALVNEPMKRLGCSKHPLTIVCQETMEFLARGGELHLILNEDGKVLGMTFLFPPASLFFQRTILVDRIYLAPDLSIEALRLVVKELVASVMTVAECLLEEIPIHSFLSVRIEVPDRTLPPLGGQVLEATLASQGFRGLGVYGGLCWAWGKHRKNDAVTTVV